MNYKIQQLIFNNPCHTSSTSLNRPSSTSEWEDLEIGHEIKSYKSIKRADLALSTKLMKLKALGIPFDPKGFRIMPIALEPMILEPMPDYFPWASPHNYTAKTPVRLSNQSHIENSRASNQLNTSKRVA